MCLYKTNISDFYSDHKMYIKAIYFNKYSAIILGIKNETKALKVKFIIVTSFQTLDIFIPINVEFSEVPTPLHITRFSNCAFPDNLLVSRTKVLCTVNSRAKHMKVI